MKKLLATFMGLLNWLLSARTWVITAVILALLFAIVHLLGWRDDVRIISGTIGSSGLVLLAIRGLLYGMLYFAAVIVSPILILAAMFSMLGRRMLDRT